jgi:hypothetical protein
LDHNDLCDCDLATLAPDRLAMGMSDTTARAHRVDDPADLPDRALETFVRAWARLAAARDLRAIGRSRPE